MTIRLIASLSFVRSRRRLTACLCVLAFPIEKYKVIGIEPLGDGNRMGGATHFKSWVASVDLSYCTLAGCS